MAKRIHHSEMKMMGVAEFSEALGNTPPSPAGRLWTIADYVREQGENLFHSLGGVPGVQTWARGQYDRFVVPLDIPWLGDAEEKKVDDQAKVMLDFTIQYFHDHVLHQQP